MMKKEEDKELKQLMQDIKRTLSQKEYSISYNCKLGLQVEKLLKKLIGEELTLPTDIRLVAKKLGLQVREKNMNLHFNCICGTKEHLCRCRTGEQQLLKRKKTPLNVRVGKFIVRKDVYTDLIEKKIYIDILLHPTMKRYTIAYGIAQFLFFESESLLNNNEEFNYFYAEDYFAMPMSPKSLNEITLDILAVFLLIPIEPFFMEYAKYVEIQKDFYMSTENWIEYLAEKVNLSVYHTACGQQNLMKIAYWIYQAHTAVDEAALKKIRMTKREQRNIKENTKYFEEKMVEMMFIDKHETIN